MEDAGREAGVEGGEEGETEVGGGAIAAREVLAEGAEDAQEESRFGGWMVGVGDHGIDAAVELGF